VSVEPFDLWLLAYMSTFNCSMPLLQVRRHQMEEERRAADERKCAEEEAKQAERKGKYELSLQREEERKQVRAEAGKQ
jgi:flagellar biosynthesis/type III secretory pathway M-ring protein FliF/YscJ